MREQLHSPLTISRAGYAKGMSTFVVVLAAGRGSRLGPGAERPKWLLDVGGRTVAERHLEAVAQAGATVASVLVVTGHAAAAIERFLAARPAAGAATATLHNPGFSELNNWWSLLLALRAISDPRARVVVLNGDFCAEEGAIAAFLAEAAGTSAQALIAVDLERTLTDESMKVALGPDGALGEIGKADVEEAAGEYVGMLMARGGALERLRDELEGFVGRPEAADQWYEGAVLASARGGVRWEVWPMPNTRWVEIDDPRDLAAARELVA